AKGLYDFDGDKAGGEISFRADEILTIISQDVGEGWWEAKKANGEQGFLPEAYVQLITNSGPPEPDFPPPPAPPSSFPASIPQSQSVQSHDSWDQPTPPAQDNWGSQQSNTEAWSQPAQPVPPQQPAVAQTSTTNNQAGLPQQQSYEDWDDDWDDDESSTTTQEELAGPGTFGLSAPNRQKPSGDPGKPTGTVSKRFGSRFSSFAKMGGDAFLLGQNTAAVPDADRKPKVIESSEGPLWLQPDNQYTCVIASPKKESKLKGLKSFIAYQITPTFSNIQVSRRYKHFDWLHERLVEKFPCIQVPPLPDKQVSGRYEDDFIMGRMRQLQQWMNRMCRHPVVSQSDVFHHFLTCTDEKKWKIGKRNAEKDPFNGGKMFFTVDVPSTPLDSKDVEAKLEVFSKFSRNMYESNSQVLNVMTENIKKHQGPYKREFQKIGHSITNLGKAFEMDAYPGSDKLTAALRNTGQTYDEIGTLYDEQPKFDSDPLTDALHEWKGLLSTWPDNINVHKSAMSKVKEVQKASDEGKMSESEAQGVVNRADSISYVTLAEIDHFHKGRVNDYRVMMKEYLQAQLEFYKKITNKVEDTLRYYDDV
ncbi:unnamed protein product, partial [Owenia fusiformis]